MAVVNQINNTLLFFLIFTMISSALAYKIVVSAYDVAFEASFYENPK